MTRPTMLRSLAPCLSGLALAMAAFCASAAAPKRVLILDSFGRDIAPFNSAVSSFRTTLARELGEPVDIYEASLDAARFAEPEKEAPFVQFLSSRFAGRPPDLIVPVGAPAVRFAAKYKNTLFSNTPILFMGVDPRLVPSDSLRTNATLATQRINLPGMIEDILQIQPGTTNIAVVVGASPLEKFWVGECRREFAPFTNRIGFTWLNDLPLDDIQKRIVALPPRSFVLYGMFVTDAAGVPYDNDDALPRLHDIANAPVFGYFASQFGMGAIGGHLYQDAGVGTLGARAAIRILRGERPETIPSQILEDATPVYDWRELRRWNIPEARLPVGSQIRFREPTFWEAYRGRIMAVTALCLGQAVLIALLVASLRRRRRAERSRRESEEQLRELREELAHMGRVNTLGALSGSLAHELNQPLGIILSNAQAAQQLLRQHPPDVAEAQAILSDIVGADRRAADVIDRLRALLKRGQASSQLLQLNQVAEQVLNLVHADLIARGVSFDRRWTDPLPPVLGDRVQLQQLLLNLIINGADAMADNPPGSRRLHLRTGCHEDRVRVSVRDEGGGLPADVESIFKPFYTTKPHGLGMGLAICRTIVAAHHGRLWAEPHEERGAVFHMELPVNGAADKT